MAKQTKVLTLRVPQPLYDRLSRLADERLATNSTLARQILAHRLGLTEHDPLGDSKREKTWPPS
jgi:hypothetical protein